MSKLSKYIDMPFTLRIVEKRLNELSSSNIRYAYDSINELNSFYEGVGSYDIFYFYLIFNEKIEDVKQFLTGLDTDYVTFDLLKYDTLWIDNEEFNRKTYKWDKTFKLNIQALFNKHAYSVDNKTEVLSMGLKNLIARNHVKEFTEFD